MMKVAAYLNLIGAVANTSNMIVFGFQLWLLALVIFNVTIFFKFHKG